VTSQAKITPANTALVKVDKNVILPVADGATELAVEFGGRAGKGPVKGNDAQGDGAISVKLCVVPVLIGAGVDPERRHTTARAARRASASRSSATTRTVTIIA